MASVARFSVPIIESGLWNVQSFTRLPLYPEDAYSSLILPVIVLEDVLLTVV